MDIAIDVGNSRTKVGIFEAGRMLDKLIFESGNSGQVRKICEQWQIEDAIVSNTGELFFQPDELPVRGRSYILSHETRLPIQSLYETPETLGRDRLASVVGAWIRFPQQASFVIDAGTCVTYDLIDDKGIYQGGNIAPGLDMRYQAMHTYTFALPLVQIGDEVPKSNRDFQYLGRSTGEALVFGGQFGLQYEIEGYIKALRPKFEQINIILTGGSADFFEEQIKTEIFVLPDLVLIGLEGILRYQKRAYE